MATKAHASENLNWGNAVSPLERGMTWRLWHLWPTNVSAFVFLWCTRSDYWFIKNWNHVICSLLRLTLFLILLEESKHLFGFYSFLCFSHESVFFRMVVVICRLAILNRPVFLSLSIFHPLILLSRLIRLIFIRTLILHRPLLRKNIIALSV